jgi:predicted RNA-binding Zn-ribbon protein involved in translation (DUF1610 family)
MGKGTSFPCQNCGHTVNVSKTKMNSADGDSVVTTCPKCGQTITRDDVISRARAVVEGWQQQTPRSS